MREWFIFWLNSLVRRLLGTKAVPSAQAIEQEAGEEKEDKKKEETFCPICGERWDEGELFCYACGYELRDEELPLHPPPVRTGGLTDPDGLIDKDVRERVGEQLSGLGRDRKWDIAAFVLPESLRKFLDPANSRRENLDGLAFCLYNTWKVGKGTGLKGLLLVIDPSGPDRALVLGKNGPRIDGSRFREWYAGMNISADRIQANPGARLSSELGYILERLKELPTA